MPGRPVIEFEHSFGGAAASTGGRAEPAGRLNPLFDIRGERYVLVTQYAGAVEQRELGPIVASLAHRAHDIVNALDVLITGV